MTQLAGLYLSPRGRIGRSVFWLYGVLPFAILAVGLVEYEKRFGTVPLEIILVPALLSWWPQGILIAKRLHDVGLSGWWAILFFLPPFAVGMAGYPEHQGTAQIAALGCALALGSLPSVSGSNRFGPGPASSAGS